MNDEVKQFRKIFLWFIGVLLVVSAIVWFANRAVSTADTAILRYEEFQEIYNTCVKVNTDLCNMKEIPETDKMFEQFSKGQRTLALKTQLNRWVEEYNAKSKMWNRSLWKSNELPYQLTVQQFSCN
jgi:uncharacterized membrane protein YfbV (UPF0208 family)